MTINATNVQSVDAQFSSATTLSYTLTANAQWLVIAHYADYGTLSSRVISGATWDGNAATQLAIADDDSGTGRIVSAFVYDVSALGADTANAVVNLNENSVCHMVCFCLESTESILYRATSTPLNGSSTDCDNSVTSVVDDFVLTFLGWDAQTDAGTTKESGQTLVGATDTTGGLLGVYSQTATGTTTNSNFSIGSADDFGSFMVPFYEDVASRAITNIDVDNNVQAGQTNITITTVGLDASPATQTATLGGESLTVNSWSSTAVNVDIPLHIDLEWGSTTNQLALTDDTGTVTLNNVTLSAPTGWETVTYNGSAPNPTTTESFYEYAQTDVEVGSFTMATNDILAWETQTGLTVDVQTIPIVDPPATVSGDYKIWDESLSTWTSVSSFTITDGGTFGGGSVPADSRKSVFKIAAYLRSTGTYTAKQTNELVVEWLVDEGTARSNLNDMLYTYLGTLGLTGTLDDRLSKWQDL
jgi:hypothetical protein